MGKRYDCMDKRGEYGSKPFCMGTGDAGAISLCWTVFYSAHGIFPADQMEAVDAPYCSGYVLPQRGKKD